MGKKCIPGIICIENVTLFLLFVVVLVLAYLYYAYFAKVMNMPPGVLYAQQYQTTMPSVVIQQAPVAVPNLVPVSTRIQDALMDPYAPPVKMDATYVAAGLPINVPTRGFPSNYSQIGILTRNGRGDLILPLMGRRSINGGSKKQYYTMSNSGNFSAKLPVSVNGKSCTSEYGCEEISNGDIVYVEGYSDTFRATVYENGLFSYIPFL
jgi:hypothetical protein